MKRCFVFFVLLIFLFVNIASQENYSNWDLDSFFDEPLYDVSEEENTDSDSTVLDLVNRRGIIFNASYSFIGMISPGWDTAPWFFDGEEEFNWGAAVKMGSSISLDARITKVFRVVSVVNFQIPILGETNVFSLGDFFFDYNFFDTVYVRGGKFEQSWGLTNILARVPSGGPSGTSYILKADVPISIGGFQALVMTRANIVGGVMPNINQLGYGVKYNLAYRWADFDLGVFYQDNMATRSFLSIKTTVGDTELYNEWLLAVNTHLNNEISFAFNLGAGRDFFDRKITVNGELFFNGEENTFLYKPKTDISEEETSRVVERFNLTFNMLYRFGGRGNPRFFTQIHYLPGQSTARLIPGFTLTPFSNIDFYMAIPMSLGSRNGYYYKNTPDPFNRPFTVILMVTLSGSIQAAYWY